MTASRNQKKELQIKEIAARLIERESNKTALITVTRVVLDDKARNGTIFVSVLPETGEDSALNFLKRKRKELREAITKGLPVHPIPFLDVAIDEGEKARRKIETLLKQDSAL
jgi:ribosome-binding factor A